MECQRVTKVAGMTNDWNVCSSKAPVRFVQLMLAVEIKSDVKAGWVVQFLTVG